MEAFLAARPVLSSIPQERHRQVPRGCLGCGLAPPAAVAGICASAGSYRRRRWVPRTSRPAEAAATVSAEEDFDYGAGKDYWDKRYQNEVGSTYDWLGGYEKFREFIEQATKDLPDGPHSARILDLGCGNARLAEDMYDEGFRNITALDISDVAIESMRSRNAEKRPGIEWVVGDAFNLEFEDGSFDLVIDKSTTDAVSCDKDHIHENLTKMYGEAQRVLKDGGTFLVFSAVESVARSALQLPHLAFNVKEKELFLPFASLWGFEAVRGGEQRMPLDEAIRQARAADLAIAEERRLKHEAEERLKSTAPSSFGVLD